MTERKTSAQGPGWPSILAVGMAVVAVGFTVGVVAGVIWEEPGLVVGHLTGETEAIDWRLGSEPSDTDETIAEVELPQAPSVAAPPPLGQRNPLKTSA